MNLADHIEIRSDIMLGKPVFRGTRIPVELILRKLGEGAEVEDLLDAYPRLSTESLQAALLYASQVLAHEERIPLESNLGKTSEMASSSASARHWPQRCATRIRGKHLISRKQPGPRRRAIRAVSSGSTEDQAATSWAWTRRSDSPPG